MQWCSHDFPRGGGGGGQGPEGRVGGEIFENVCIKMAFFWNIECNCRVGVIMCIGLDQSLTFLFTLRSTISYRLGPNDWACLLKSFSPCVLIGTVLWKSQQGPHWSGPAERSPHHGPTVLTVLGYHILNAETILLLAQQNSEVAR